jgi:hypothetical protein
MEGIAAVPEWSPAGENHLLRSTSVVQKIKYADTQIAYQTFDNDAHEVLRLTSKPLSVSVNGSAMKEVTNKAAEGWLWEPLSTGGILRIRHVKGSGVSIKLGKELV